MLRIIILSLLLTPQVYSFRLYKGCINISSLRFHQRCDHKGTMRRGRREEEDADYDIDIKQGVVPFDSSDFQRKDILIPKALKPPVDVHELLNLDAVGEYMEKPTGYDDDDDGDDKTDFVPLRIDEKSLDAAATKLFQDLYVPSPYDSKKKKDAKFVIRNITAISVGIGILFAAIWVLFPGQFISYRGDHISTVAASNQLLKEEGDTNPTIYFDEPEIGSPPIQQQTRFPFEKKEKLAPAQTLTL